MCPSHPQLEYMRQEECFTKSGEVVKGKLLPLTVVLCTVLMMYSESVPNSIRADEPSAVSSLRERLRKKSTHEKDVDFTASQRSCGVESLYLLMQLCDRPCSLEQIKNLVVIQENGSSLHDSQSAAERMRLPLECIRCTPDELSKLALPVIAHMEPIPEMRFVNHFVVLVRVDDASVTVVDPADNGVHEMPRHAWTHMATGYYLSSRSNLFGWEWMIAWLLTGFIILGFWFRWPNETKSLPDQSPKERCDVFG